MPTPVVPAITVTAAVGTAGASLVVAAVGTPALVVAGGVAAGLAAGAAVVTAGAGAFGLIASAVWLLSEDKAPQQIEQRPPAR